MNKRMIALFMSALTVLSIAGCGQKQKEETYKPISGLDTDQNVTLTIAIPYETNKALNDLSNAFMNRYPNVSVQLQYVEDYDHSVLPLFKENQIDMILQKDVKYEAYTITDEATKEKTPDGTDTDDYFYNFAEDKEIDFSDTTSDLTNNYRHTVVDEEGNDVTKIYCYPLGGETRGVFVNLTLLKQYGLEVPENYTEFLKCCETLKQNGLIPIQGGGDTAAFGLSLAPAANAVVHDEQALADFAAAKPGVSKEFEAVMEKLYTLSTNRYFDYKAVEQTGFFKTTNELGQAQSFLGLKVDETTFEMEKPENNYGNVAFLPYISSTETVILSLIEEYNLDTQVQFILSPLNDKGTGSAAYITPYYGICANKNSENLNWIREFVNFMFQEEQIKNYAKAANIIPNCKDAMKIVAEKYGIDQEKDVTLCGQIRFSDDYNGYTPIAVTAKNIMKCSAQKYMVKLNRSEDGTILYETDENGAEVLSLGSGEETVKREYVGEEDPSMPGFAFCTLQYFLDGMENDLSEYRVD